MKAGHGVHGAAQKIFSPQAAFLLLQGCDPCVPAELQAVSAHQGQLGASSLKVR